MMARHFDTAVIGAGIVGLAHAWMASQRGQRVLVLERSPVARGASVRNFGMIWPIGQPSGRMHDLAMRSRDFWLKLGELGVLDVQPCGSIHLAHRADELAVLREFCDSSTHATRMLTADETINRAPMANPQGLLGGMLSPSELRVDPRVACSALASWLSSHESVECHFETTVTRIEGHTIYAADGQSWAANRVIVCSGSDLKTLYPDVLASSGLRLCKLQMLKTVANGADLDNAPLLASGLTLRHYTSFESCRSLEALRRRIATETPELDRYGIHVMASPFPNGNIILGDSHEYDDQITPFDNSEIDDLILRELRKVIRLDNWHIVQRWHGTYAKHPELPVFQTDVTDNVSVFVGTGGAGMTLAFGLADRAWRRWMGENES